MWIKTEGGNLVNLDTGNNIFIFEEYDGRLNGVGLSSYSFDAEGCEGENYQHILPARYSREYAQDYLDKLAKKLGAEEV